MKIWVVAEVVYGNEGCPAVYAFTTKEKAQKLVDALNEENGEDEDILVIMEEADLDNDHGNIKSCG